MHPDRREPVDPALGRSPPRYSGTCTFRGGQFTMPRLLEDLGRGPPLTDGSRGDRVQDEGDRCDRVPRDRSDAGVGDRGDTMAGRAPEASTGDGNEENPPF